MRSTILSVASAVLLLANDATSLVIRPPTVGVTTDVSQSTNPFLPRSDPLCLTQLLSVVPSASSCANASFPSECAAASEALNPILDGFTKYSITTAPEQAALLSWMAFESGEFKFNQNHFPGRPGQGTRCMMMPNFVREYVASIPELAPQAIGKDDVAVLALVLPDEYSFASASWFYSAHCTEAVKQGVQTGSKSGWSDFLTECVGTTVDESREVYWTRAMQALGVPIS